LQLLATAITLPLQHKDRYGGSHETHITLCSVLFLYNSGIYIYYCQLTCPIILP